MNKIWKIYKITNFINGKVYIGQTILVGVQFDSYWGSGVFIKQSIKKYGKENFVKEILIECDCQEDADEAEKFYIKEFNSIKKGYNFNIGGGNGRLGTKHSKISKNKMSKSANERWINMSESDRIEFSNKMTVINKERSSYVLKDEFIKRGKIGGKISWNKLTPEQRIELSSKGGRSSAKKLTHQQRVERGKKARQTFLKNKEYQNG
jgi:group I intron endonuclease